MIYQVVPPDDHRHNIEEKSIKTWKYHFIGVLIGNVATFPMNLWCQLTREISINTGKITRKHKKSVCVHLYGPHDYNTLPFVPIGMDTLIHKKPTYRKTFTEHCKKAYVLGTSCEHYHCWNLWVIETHVTRDSVTVFF